MKGKANKSGITIVALVICIFVLVTTTVVVIIVAKESSKIIEKRTEDKARYMNLVNQIDSPRKELNSLNVQNKEID